MENETLPATRVCAQWPTSNQLATLVAWNKHGNEALTSSELSGTAPSGRPETESLIRIRELILRLDGPSSLEAMRRLAVGKAGGVLRLPHELPLQLFYRARLRGLVTHDCSEVLPWTAAQAYVVWLLAQGVGVEQCREITGISEKGVRESLLRARKLTDVHTTTHLVALAYQRGWMPDDAERDVLEKMIIGDIKGWEKW